jgi:methyl-accepting chemotaxis protein
MDTVTQQNAANAEESASASEELNAQAESLGHMVRDLRQMVGGRLEAEDTAGGRRAESAHPTRHEIRFLHQAKGAAAAKPGDAPSASHPSAQHPVPHGSGNGNGKGKRDRPEDLIPLDSEKVLNRY